MGEGVVSGGGGWFEGRGVVTFQSVDRRTHECQGFLSRQRHLDGRLRDHQQQRMNRTFSVKSPKCTKGGKLLSARFVHLRLARNTKKRKELVPAL